MAWRYRQLLERGHGSQLWWVPLESMPLISILPHFWLELICRKTRTTRWWCLLHASCQLHAQRWARYMEALFIHLIHLLHVILSSDCLVGTLDNRFVAHHSPHGFWTNDAHLRFHCVLSYGNGVIHKFANNTSEMKRLAARDFEDMLQVCLIGQVSYMCDWYLSQCALPIFEGLFQATTTKLYSHFCTVLHNGMLSPNWCTLIVPCQFWMRPSSAFPINCASSKIFPALLSPPWSCWKKWLLTSTRPHSNAQPWTIQIWGVVAEGSRNSIWIPTNFMPWGIISSQSGFLEC